MSLTMFPDPMVSANPDGEALRHRQVDKEGLVLGTDLKRELGVDSLSHVHQTYQKGWETRIVLEH